MTKYILQRIAFAILTLFIISIFVYVLVAAFGNNPVNDLAQAQFQASKKSGLTYAEILHKLEIENGLRYKDNPDVLVPIIVRYGNYMKNIFTKGDFGFLYNPANNPNSALYTNMAKLFFTPLQYSLIITVPTFFISSILGIAIGVIAGYKRGK
jgi:hypothetical protein